MWVCLFYTIDLCVCTLASITVIRLLTLYSKCFMSASLVSRVRINSSKSSLIFLFYLSESGSGVIQSWLIKRKCSGWLLKECSLVLKKRQSQKHILFSFVVTWQCNMWSCHHRLVFTWEKLREAEGCSPSMYPDIIETMS